MVRLQSLGACGHLRCFQHPCELLDSFSGLSGEVREGGMRWNRRVKGSTLEVAFNLECHDGNAITGGVCMSVSRS